MENHSGGGLFSCLPLCGRGGLRPNGKRCGGAENLRDVFPYPYTERDARDCKNGGLPDSELYALVCERG